MQQPNRKRKLILLLAKLLLTGGGLWFVFHKIDTVALLQELKSARIFLLLLAMAFFILSKIISSRRLNVCFQGTGLLLPERLNRKLYWLGMYYNLFLPGGIGGDGYKVYLLNKQYAIPVKKLVRAIFMDRISGLVAIVAIALLLLLITDLLPWMIFAAPAAVLLLYGGYRWMVRRIFSEFSAKLTLCNLQSLGVQLAQMLCVLLIMYSLRMEGHYFSHLLIFFVSSVAAVLPLTIGGVGAREVVFLFGANYFGLDPDRAVAISLLFFGITMLVSLAGSYFSFDTARLFPHKSSQS